MQSGYFSVTPSCRPWIGPPFTKGLDTAAMRSTFPVEDGDAIPHFIYVDSLFVIFQMSTMETHFLEYEPPAVLVHMLL